jgi:hyperosmotically inducible periplasmic protein
VADSQADKNVAGMRANSVTGIFTVTNDLTVAGPENKRVRKFPTEDLPMTGAL